MDAINKYVAEKELFKIKFNFEVEVVDLKTRKVIQNIKKHNLITSAGKNLVRDILGMASGVTGVNYIALGTSDTAPVVGNTTINNEVHRSTLTDVIYDTAKVTFKYYLASTEANGNTLNEAGLFGDDATATVDSGTLFSHVTYTDVVKTSAVGVTFSWDITIS